MNDRVESTLWITTALAIMVVAGCNAGEVESPPVDMTGTDGGYGDTGDTEGSNQNECWADNAPAEAVRWQCEGIAEAAIFGTLDVQVPDWLENGDFIQMVIDHGRLDSRELFGPWNNEGYDEPGIDACCLPEIGGDDEDEDSGVDETGADAPPDMGADESIPQAAVACANDCVDQACRKMPRVLRDLASEIPGGIPVAGPSYRQQLRDLANWVAANHGDCYDSLRADGIDAELGGYEISGEWQIPNDPAWPDITELSIDSECKIFDWYLPEQGDPQACTGINDNNDEDPFGRSGASMGGFDTFAPTGGRMKLDGPTIFGVDADGSAPILGFGDACPRGECSGIDAWVTDDVLELQRVVLVTPSAMEWQQDGMRLVVEGLHAMVEHAWSIPLVDEGDAKRFEIPAGKLELLFAGEVHGVPIKVSVPTVTPVTGMVTPLFDGSHGVVIDPFVVEHRDGYGTWSMQVTLGELVALEHAPRATFVGQDLDGSTMYDASASFDPDGEPLMFEWFLDGASVGEGAMLIPESITSGSTLAVQVSDATGRSSWSYGLTVGD